MSVEATSAAWASGAEGNDLLVLLALGDWASIHDDDDEQRCWPSIAKIAARTHLSDRTVQRCLRTLVAVGAVTIGAHPNWQGRADRAPNTYTISIRRGDILTPRDGERGDNGDVNGVTPVSPNTKERETELSLLGVDTPADARITEPGFNAAGFPVTAEQLSFNQYPVPFEKTWALYPEPRRREKRGAYKAWRATVFRVVKESKRTPHNVMLDLFYATRHYAAEMTAKVNGGTSSWSYMKLPSTWFGPAEPWQDYVRPPGPEATERKDWQA